MISIDFPYIARHLYFIRLPKFKSEVKKVIRIPLPACIVDQLTIEESRYGGSYAHRRSERPFSSRFSNGVSNASHGQESEYVLTPNIKRIKSLPLNKNKEQTKVKNIHDVKCSSSFTSHQSPPGQRMTIKG
jgi:hypothetical protein